LEAVLGKCFVRQSLKTASYPDAVRLARKLSYECEIMFEEARERLSKHGSADHPALPELPAVVSSGPPVISTKDNFRVPLLKQALIPEGPKPLSAAQCITLRQLYAKYMSDPAVVRTPRTILAYQTSFERLLELLDGETPIQAITRQDCRNLLDAIRVIPSNATKKYGAMKLEELASRAKADKQPLMSATTVNSYIQKLSALLNWAVKEELLHRNPARGLKVVDPIRRKDKRLPFSNDQLTKIFNAPIYRGCVDDEYGYSRSGPNRPRRSKFWIPLIGLYSGMRLNEICQMNKEDIREIEGIPCFIVTAEASHSEDRKRLKTANSERIVPVHPLLQRIGIIDFAKESRLQSYKVFEDVRRTATGYYSDDFSRWFRHFLTHCGAKTPKASFHSFRHNFRDAMRRAKVDREIVYALGGWAAGGSNEGSITAENYGNGYPIKMLFEAVSMISYPALDLTHLLAAPKG
jgi:integrase